MGPTLEPLPFEQLRPIVSGAKNQQVVDDFSINMHQSLDREKRVAFQLELICIVSQVKD